MIDDICRHLYSKMATEEWTDIDELYAIIKKQSLGPQETEEVLGFLKKYFVEVDESKRKARLNPWIYNLFGAPAL